METELVNTGWLTEKCGKRGEERWWKKEDVAWKLVAGLRGQKMGKIEEPSKSQSTKRDRRPNFGITFHHTLCTVGDVIQGDVRPHVSAHLSLEGHPERWRVGQDDISVHPLATMVSCGCPHQQSSATGPDGVDLLKCKTNVEFCF